MTPTSQGVIVLVATLAVLLSGAPVAFGLGALSLVFLVLFQGFDSLQVVAETFWAGLNDFTLVSIPMFVMMGPRRTCSRTWASSWPARSSPGRDRGSRTS